MNSVEIPGSQEIFADGKIIQKKLVAGTSVNPPGGNGVLVSSETTTLPGGIQRGSYEYVQFGASSSDNQQASPQIEIIGGSREVPVQTHPKFANLSSENIAAVTAAAEQNDSSLLPEEMDGDLETLYNLLRSKVTHFLAPAIVARVTSTQSVLPSFEELCKLGSAPGVPGAPSGSKWIQTGISATGFGNSWQVSYEYTLLGDGRDFANFLY